MESKTEREAKAKKPSYEEVMKILSDPLALKVLELAKYGEVHPDELSKKLEVTRPSIYKRLQAFLDASFIERVERPDGKVVYRLKDEARILYENSKKDYYAFIRGVIKERPGEIVPVVPMPELIEAKPTVSQRIASWLKGSFKLLSGMTGKLSARHAFLLMEAVVFIIGAYCVIFSVIAFPDLMTFLPYFVIGLSLWLLAFGLHLAYKYVTMKAKSP